MYFIKTTQGSANSSKCHAKLLTIGKKIWQNIVCLSNELGQWNNFADFQKYFVDFLDENFKKYMFASWIIILI